MYRDIVDRHTTDGIESYHMYRICVCVRVWRGEIYNKIIFLRARSCDDKETGIILQEKMMYCISVDSLRELNIVRYERNNKRYKRYMREKMNKRFLLRDISFVRVYHVIGPECKVQVWKAYPLIHETATIVGRPRASTGIIRSTNSNGSL